MTEKFLEFSWPYLYTYIFLIQVKCTIYLRYFTRDSALGKQICKGFFVYEEILALYLSYLAVTFQVLAFRFLTVFLIWKPLNFCPCLGFLVWITHASFKSISRRCSIKKSVLKNFVIFTGKCLCWSLFLIKLQS